MDDLEAETRVITPHGKGVLLRYEPGGPNKRDYEVLMDRMHPLAMERRWWFRRDELTPEESSDGQ